ncbi:MAG TPA: serine protease [Chitinophagaceae bacterium]
MDDTMILEAVERYIRGEMNPDERLHFENLRKTNAEVDQLVVEHTLFMQQMNRFGEWQKFRTKLNEVHTDLAEQGKIDSAKLRGKAKVVYLFNRYKRVAAIAACIAGITTISLSAVVWSVSPKSPSEARLTELDRKIEENEKKTTRLESYITSEKKPPANTPVISYKTVGTGFFIDPRGLMITNAHVVKNSKNISVFNSKGDKFNAIVAKLDPARDVAIIKIDDDKFKPFSSLPYGISKASSEIAESVFTLGYPRDEVVYGEGYMSAKTGNNGDTLSCQISIAANPGNSGGPVFNHNGQVIGILSTKKPDVEATVFAVQSKYIYQALEELKKNPIYKGNKISAKSSLSGVDRVQQVKKIQDYVFMVKGD